MTSTEYSKGYMAGLADAQKQAVSGLTGKPVAKKVWIKCPVCKVESPMQDPDAELLATLKAIVKSLADQDDEGMIEHAQQMIDARAAIAKAEGRA